jgi:hypothetical protein
MRAEAIRHFTEAIRINPKRHMAPRRLLETLQTGPVARSDELLADLDDHLQAATDPSPYLLAAAAYVRLHVPQRRNISLALDYATRAADGDWRQKPDILAVLAQAHLRQALEELAKENGEIRINCGGKQYRGQDGTTWGRDRFFVGGRSVDTQPAIHGTDDDTLYRTERLFLPSSVRAGYRIPVLPGLYRVTLHFAEVPTRTDARQTFTVLLEAEEMSGEYAPVLHQAGKCIAESRVEDAFLDIEFVPGSTGTPSVSAIEITRIE